MKKTYQTFLFDWDGTIVNTLPLWEKAWNYAAQNYQIEMSYKQATSQVFGRFSSHPLFEKVSYLDFLDLMYRVVDEGLAEVELNPGILGLIDNLNNQDKNCLVVTSSKRETLEPFVEKYNLTDKFVKILAFEDVSKLKPDPEIVHKALEFTATPSQKCLIIGDSEVDVLAGQAAGIDTAVYAPEHNQIAHDKIELEKLKPTYLFESFDLADFF